MSAEGRRQRIHQLLLGSEHPLTGAELAQRLNVSRQVIVQDIALLRSAGADILATPRGYLVNRPARARQLQRLVACRHRAEEVEEELMLMVSLGAEVLDVIVEHPLYGEISGHLMLGNSADVREFMRQLSRAQARLLSSLTDGVHLHTVSIPDLATYYTVRDALQERGFLVDDKS